LRAKILKRVGFENHYNFPILDSMKRLIVVRHAKSSWDEPSMKDIDRPLNDRGIKDAPKMAKRLKENEVYPDIVLTSTAQRALSTCEEFCKILNFPAEKIQKEKKLYHASEEGIFEILKSVPDLKDNEEVVMIFGHNPGLTEFVNTLLNEDIENIPTCGIVSSELNISKWQEIKPGSGDLEYFDFPKRKKD
jgi:phosphohistidine phosphatase